ncbi:hypothetical protein PIB30_060817, partial [Stylosanthes scabra]|nr:hypothetical protein [Stylosanthes scabra]
APSSYKSKLGLQRGLDLARKLEIPILAIILILPDGTVRSRSTPSDRAVNRNAALTLHPHGSHDGTVRLLVECISKRSQGHVRSHEGSALFLTSWLPLVIILLLMPSLAFPMPFSIPKSLKYTD